ncbi:hypothetical protein HDU76_009859, partial [Blyttiomyces sp. JEL0837]
RKDFHYTETTPTLLEASNKRSTSSLSLTRFDSQDLESVNNSNTEIDSSSMMINDTTNSTSSTTSQSNNAFLSQYTHAQDPNAIAELPSAPTETFPSTLASPWCMPVYTYKPPANDSGSGMLGGVGVLPVVPPPSPASGRDVGGGGGGGACLVPRGVGREVGLRGVEVGMRGIGDDGDSDAMMM